MLDRLTPPLHVVEPWCGRSLPRPYVAFNLYILNLVASRASAMDLELNQCLNAIPGFVAQLEMEVHSTDLNLVEWLIMRAELFLELLRVLSGEFQYYS